MFEGEDFPTKMSGSEEFEIDKSNPRVEVIIEEKAG